MAYPLAGHVRSGDEIGRFSRTSKSAWLRVLMSSRLGWREPAGDRRYLSQDRSIIAKTAADGAAVFYETPSLKAPRLQTVRNLLSILFRLFCIIGHGALKPQHTIAR